jgi:hypothetical protein
MLLAISHATGENAAVFLVRVLLQTFAKISEIIVDCVGKLIVLNLDQIGGFIVGHTLDLELGSVENVPILSPLLDALLDRRCALDGASVAQVCRYYHSVCVDGVANCGGAPAPSVQAQGDDRSAKRVEEVDNDLSVCER